MPHNAISSAYLKRHIGPQSNQQQEMLQAIGFSSLEQLMNRAVPQSIRQTQPLAARPALAEEQLAQALDEFHFDSKPYVQLIGQGYYDTVTPAVIRRNILANPGWYTSYTPYQAEISQGRLEAQLIFQQVIQDLTGLPIANASLLDEASAGAEAVALARRANRKGSYCVVDKNLHPQVLAVMRTRATCLGIDLKVCEITEETDFTDAFAVVAAQITTTGIIKDLANVVKRAKEAEALVVLNVDLLAATLLVDAATLGADVTFGSSQRFGVPLFYGGPHAAFMSVRRGLERSMPGRLVGVSKDADGKPAYRLTLQTREQHIRRERATSNICTAQALLAVMAGMYAVWHGPEGLRGIAQHCHNVAWSFASALTDAGVKVEPGPRFDTVCWQQAGAVDAAERISRESGINVRIVDENHLAASFGESHSCEEACDLAKALGVQPEGQVCLCHDPDLDVQAPPIDVPAQLLRTTEYLTHPTFHRYRSETAMMRYLRVLADKDLALDRSMIPLGSCTMKLNPAAAMELITDPRLANVHPFAPTWQTRGWIRLIADTASRLLDITGYDQISFQPNSGAQGEFTGLLAIRRYHEANGDHGRNVCLIPKSAHGTNAASAALAGLKVVVVETAQDGSIDVEDLRQKCADHREDLAAIMITYPSTHGVYEDTVTQVCQMVHDAGGQVYIDGANLNALVGIAQPGKFGGDISHLNLHKTFAIPHGGGGPGIGPVLCRNHLGPFLPGDASPRLGSEGDAVTFRCPEDSEAEAQAGLISGAEGEEFAFPVAATAHGSAGVLPITWAYLSMLGSGDLAKVTAGAVLAANYLASQLRDSFPVLYTGADGLVAHECILDIRPLQHACGVSAEDVAKRLIDYGFHAPTLAFPVAGTLMVEPTESEPKEELDRFIAAMKAIRAEIDQVIAGKWTIEDSPLRNSPHTATCALDEWPYQYSRQQALYPAEYLYAHKYFPPVRRIDNVYGDRNLMCTCPPPEAFETH